MIDEPKPGPNPGDIPSTVAASPDRTGDAPGSSLPPTRVLPGAAEAPATVWSARIGPTIAYSSAAGAGVFPDPAALEEEVAGPFDDFVILRLLGRGSFAKVY